MTYEEKRKLFSIFTSKKKKKEILDRLFDGTKYFEIEYILKGNDSLKAFKVFYKLAYESLVDFYKNAWDKTLLNTIPLNIVSSEFLREVMNVKYTFELYGILTDEKVSEELKETIYNIFEKEIEEDIKQLSIWSLKNLISSKGLYSKLEDKIIERISRTNYIGDFSDIFSNSEISEEIKKKLFDLSKENIRQQAQKANLSSLLYYLEAKDALYTDFADLIIDSLKDKGIDEYNIHYLIQFFIKAQVPDDVKKRVFSVVDGEQLKEQIKNKSSYELIQLLNDSHCFKEFLDIIIDMLSQKISVGEMFQFFSSSNRIPNEIKDIMFEKIKPNLEHDISLLKVYDIDGLSKDIENTYGKFRQLINSILGKRNLDLERKFLSMTYSVDKEKIFEDNKNAFEQMLLNFTDEQFVALVINSYLENRLYDKGIDLIVKVLVQRNIDSNILFSLLMKPYLSDEIKEKIYNATESRILEMISGDNIYDFIAGEDFGRYGGTMYPKVLTKMIEPLSNSFHKFDLNKQDIIISRINTLSVNDKSIFFKNVFNISEDKIDYFSNLLSFYHRSPTKFLNSYAKFKYLLNIVHIDVNIFFQYSLGLNYDWLSDILNIVNTLSITNFINIKNYFFTKFYPQGISENKIITNFLELVKNYNRYPELLMAIANSNRELTNEEKEQISFLFSKSEIIGGKDKPTSIEDCNNLKEIFKNELAGKLKNIEAMSLTSLKELISQVLFNAYLYNVQEKLEMYGNPEELTKLQFNNRKHPEFNKDVSFMKILATMIEEVINCNDIESLKQILENILKNYELTYRVSQIFSNYEERMKILYEKEANLNFTKINSDKLREKVLDKERTQRYGVDVYDFSDKAYILNAHVKSGRETIEGLVNGEASGEMNFICLGPISHANQVYYGGHGIIFATDEIPYGNFIASSTSNMGSNAAISKNSGEVKNIKREQRGLLEVSSAKYGNNPEMLAFRKDIKFKYIVLPDSREATLEEREIAKKYGLKFVLTQPSGKRVENPISLEEDLEISNAKENNSLEELKQLKEALLQTTQTKPRRIAILTDEHALFEPTLAILEDARRNGVDEIYSLGDEVGTGPNPKETLELLESYGVQSVSGNHNDYVTEGVMEYQNHLRGRAYNEALRNSDWTRSQLTSEQISKMQLYPSMIELSLGGEKILLCHTVEDLKNGQIRISSENYKQIFQGHTHFKGKDGNIFTLRGAGIGAKGDDVKKAYYVILAENPDGGFSVEERYVPFDVRNVQTSINVSDLPLEDKNKISNWVEPGRSR